MATNQPDLDQEVINLITRSPGDSIAFPSLSLPDMKAILTLSLFLVVGCASLTATPNSPSDENRLHPDYAPTPFSAEELYRGFPEGTELKFELGEPDQPHQFQTMTFTGITETEVLVQVDMADADGTSLPATPPSKAKWADLQSHGSFPAATTTISREYKASKFGKVECWHYTVSSAEEGPSVVSHYWWDVKRPGPPIELTTEADGVTVFKLEMISDSR